MGMSNRITASRLCGRCAIKLHGQSMLGAECHCTSCRQATDRFEARLGAAKERSAMGGVPDVLWRTDRVGKVEGLDLLASYRLSPEARTRRVVASGCSAPMFRAFTTGHWISVNAARLPADQRPVMDVRTMTADRGDAPPLSDDVPNARGHPPGSCCGLWAHRWQWVSVLRRFCAA
jgi:hypothetical protein